MNKEINGISLTAFRLVHTNQIWQDCNKEFGAKWCEISMYDMDGNLITTGHDSVIFSPECKFLIECNKDEEGFTYYGALFTIVSCSYNNSLEIKVTNK